MTLNDEIEALVLKNTRINPVNQTAYKNAFLLLSSTRALNELVSNTRPSDRARKEGIEDDAAYLKTPTGGRSDRTEPKASPKTDATPAQKRGRGRPKDTNEKKVAKAATKDIIKEGKKNVLKVAKAAKAKADKAATAKKNAELKATTAAAKAETARIAKEREELASRKEGQTIPLGDVKLRGGNSSDRRLGTKKTQKKKK
jgi:hypothetical protein